LTTESLRQMLRRKGKRASIQEYDRGTAFT
jgi:hypothetical protein